MRLQTFQYVDGKGWSVNAFPQLDSENTLVLVFAAPEFISKSDPIKELAKHYPNSKIIGCSGAGEIAGPMILDKSLSVAVACFEKTSLKIVNAAISNTEDSFTAGERLAQQLKQDGLKGILVLSDGLKINGSDLVNGLNTIGDDKLTITGGLAGDGRRFKHTWTIFNGDIYENHIVAVGFYGNSIHIGHASLGGWDIFGLERRITKANKNILYELDQQPALMLYKTYLGDKANGLPATGLLYPLAIRSHAENSRHAVRTILAFDDNEQSLTFAGDVPTGYLAQLMRANFDRLINSAGEVGDITIKRMVDSANTRLSKDSPVLAVAISGLGRRLLLGERAEEETEAVLSSLPPATQQVGFYSYGELSPLVNGNCDLHNQTMTLTTYSQT